MCLFSLFLLPVIPVVKITNFIFRISDLKTWNLLLQKKNQVFVLHIAEILETKCKHIRGYQTSIFTAT